MSLTTKPTVLVVEDDFVDLEIVRRNIRRRGLDVDVLSVQDGHPALELLRSEFVDNRRCDKLIVLLDINMPGMNGHQFLEEIRSDPYFKRLLVFMLTTSDHPRDISRAYEMNVAGYFLKANLDGLIDTLASYIEHAQFPPLETLSTV